MINLMIEKVLETTNLFKATRQVERNRGVRGAVAIFKSSPVYSISKSFYFSFKKTVTKKFVSDSIWLVQLSIHHLPCS